MALAVRSSFSGEVSYMWLTSLFLRKEMSEKHDSRWRHWVAAGAFSAVMILGPVANAGDLKITLPKRSQLTPVQRLNREGVEALRKHHYEKAESLFYKAYLFDPDYPFTLNNLGYISELQGQVERAQRFYALAGQQRPEAR